MGELKKRLLSWLSRKAIATLLVVILATLLLWVGKISEIVWADVLKWIVGIFLGANAVQKFASSLSGQMMKPEKDEGRKERRLIRITEKREMEKNDEDV